MSDDANGGVPGRSLPPLPSPDAPDEERALAVEGRWVARHGAPTLDHYRAVYRRLGVDWPGDDVARRHFYVSENGVISSPAGATPPSAA